MTRHHPPGRRTHGFTLIELLVVIGLIAVLLAVMIPNVTGARRTASSRAAQQYGANVTLTVNGFLTSRPGLTAATLLGAFPTTVSTTGLPSNITALLGTTRKDCGAGYTLSGTTTAPAVSAGGDDNPNLASWSAAPANARCIITTAPGTPTNAYAIRIVTWSDRQTAKAFTNGRE